MHFSRGTLLACVVAWGKSAIGRGERGAGVARVGRGGGWGQAWCVQRVPRANLAYTKRARSRFSVGTLLTCYIDLPDVVILKWTELIHSNQARYVTVCRHTGPWTRNWLFHGRWPSTHWICASCCVCVCVCVRACARACMCSNVCVSKCVCVCV